MDINVFFKSRIKFGNKKLLWKKDNFTRNSHPIFSIWVKILLSGSSQAKTSLKNAFLQRYSFAQPKNSLVRIIEDYANLTIMFMNRRKINTEGKGRRAACRALAILHQDDLNNRMKRSKEFNQFCLSSSSDDLSLLFCINPSFMFYIG